MDMTFSLLLMIALIATGCNATSQNGSQSGGSSGGNPAPGIVTLDSEESAFVSFINAYRVQSGAPALTVSVTLTQASQWQSVDMATHNYLDHTDSSGRDFSTRLGFFGYPSDASAMGENVAAGNETAQDTFTQWQNSPPHNANMLDASYLALGVGRAYASSSTYGWYWTTDFGSVVDSALTP
jgi:uncharacterized protein YkwD